MFNIFKKVSLLGVDNGVSFAHKKKVTLINSMSIILFTIYFVFFFVSEARFMLNNAIMAGVQIPALLLNYKKKHRLATSIFIYSNLLVLLYLTLMYGHALGAGYAMICWGLLVAYIFDRYRDMLPHVLIGGFSFVWANVYIFRNGPLEEIPQDFVGISVIGLCFFTPLFVSRIYKGEHDEFQEIIQGNNRVLNRQSQEIAKQAKMLEKRNTEIDTQLQTIESAYSEIQSSMRYAQRIQKALLPMRSLLAKDFPEHCLFYKPKDIVSGDFYWFHSIDNISIIAVADCTGHGVPGAFMNAIGNTLLNQIVNKETISRPDIILQRLNEHLMSVFNHGKEEDEKINDGIEIALCCIDKQSKQLLFSSAKRPLYFFHEGDLQIVKGSKYSVDGLQTETKTFELTTLDYTERDMIYLFSDGYADQFGGHNYKKMKITTFRKTLIDIYEEPAQAQEAILRYQFSAWKGDHEQIDDILVVGIRL